MKSFHHINYANHLFSLSQRKNCETALTIGNFDKSFGYGPSDIDRNFSTTYASILNQKKGGGYWLWKPYILWHHLNIIQLNDMVFYTDAGSFFVAPMDIFRDLLSTNDIITFELGNTYERNWTKRDAFITLNCDAPLFSETPQRTASFLAFRKSSFTLDFLQTYLEYCCQWDILSDGTSQIAPDYCGFRAHRHDQSILSLLSKKAELPAFRDPSQYGAPFQDEFSNSDYPQLIQHTRKRNGLSLKNLFGLR